MHTHLYKLIQTYTNTHTCGMFHSPPPSPLLSIVLDKESMCPQRPYLYKTPDMQEICSRQALGKMYLISIPTEL